MTRVWRVEGVITQAPVGAVVPARNVAGQRADIRHRARRIAGLAAAVEARELEREARTVFAETSIAKDGTEIELALTEETAVSAGAA